jgi:shikimate kinase
VSSRRETVVLPNRLTLTVTPNPSPLTLTQFSISVRTDKLYLVGFMGSGKSTVARALGKRVGWRVEDVDERIEARERRTVAAIFAQDGEAHFRDVERDVLFELLPMREAVIATGGGTFAEPDNRAAMLADAPVAWLDVPFDRLIDRVPPDGRRPLAADRVQMEQLYNRRVFAYRQAHLRVDATRPVEEVVERLLEWIGF